MRLLLLIFSILGHSVRCVRAPSPPSRSPNPRSYSADSSKLLDILVANVYADKSVFIRELISNSQDAIFKRDSHGFHESGLISVDIDSKTGVIAVTDNGVGMCQDELSLYLGTVGRSSTERKKAADSESRESLIGQFGVGFYSVFLVSDNIRVISKCAKSDEEHMWYSVNRSEYDVMRVADAERLLNNDKTGTAVIIKLKSELSGEYTEVAKMMAVINKFNKYATVKIHLSLNGELQSILGGNEPLWRLNDIREEDVVNFYTTEFHDEKKPVHYDKFGVAGDLSYEAVVFIPAKPIINLLDAVDNENASTVSLYVNRVLITDQLSGLLPPYLSFVRGAVDAKNLPLKLDREEFSDSRALKQLRRSFLSNVLGTLKRMSQEADKDFEKMERGETEKSDIANLVKYIAFWKQYSGFILTGCANSRDKKIVKNLAILNRVYSVRNPGFKISLDYYVKHMPQHQNIIYYLHVDNVNRIEDHPALEIFKNSSIDVLLVTGPFDEACFHNLSTYMGYTIKNLAKDSIDITDVALIQSTSVQDKIKRLSSLRSTETEATRLFNPIVELMAKHLGVRKAQTVKISQRLTDKPVFVSSPEDGYTPSMDRMMRVQLGTNVDMQNIYRQLRTLEINANSTIIKKLNELAATHHDDKWLGECIDILYEIALLISGYENINPKLLALDALLGLQARLETVNRQSDHADEL